MPLDQLIIGLPNYTITKHESGYPDRLHVRYDGEVSCPLCNCKNLRKKDRLTRKVRHTPTAGDRLIDLYIESYKFECKGCKKFFNQRFEGVMPRARSSEPFRDHVSYHHMLGHTQKDLAKDFRIGPATVERWYQNFCKLKVKMQSNRLCPKVIGIDEHFFTKKRGYATTIADLTKHKVFDVVLGRSEASLAAYLRKLEGRDRVKVVVMDMAEVYRSIVRKYFPNAKIVSDRFHVIRLINQSFMELWKEIDPIGRKHRGLVSLMRQHGWNLRPKSRENLERYLDEYPELRPIYEFKQGLAKLMLHKHRTAKECKKLIPQFLQKLEDLKSSGFRSMQRLGESLYRWQEEIVRMWRFTKTNGITEGLHNKMEMISRRAYGFRNFENYRLRVRVLCG